jgi:DNA polymerase III subunit beta
MKITVNRTVLKDALKVLIKFVPGKTTLDILMSVLLQADMGTLKITANSIEEGLSVTIPAQIEDPGSVCINAKMSSELIASMDGTDLLIERKPATVSLECGKSKHKIKWLEENDFPPLPTLLGDRIKFNLEEFKGALQQVIYAASIDGMRPLLTGVQFSFEGKKMWMVGTDGFRLAIKNVNIHPFDHKPMVVPARFLARLVSSAKGDEIEMLFDQNDKVAFRTETQVYFASVLVGTFPDWGMIVPKSFAKTMNLPAEMVLHAIKRADLIAATANHLIQLRGVTDTLTISGQSVMGDTTQTTLQIPGNVELCFNGVFLRQAIEAIGTPEVTLNWNLPNAPVQLIPVGMNGYQTIVMPMHDQNAAEKQTPVAESAIQREQAEERNDAS